MSKTIWKYEFTDNSSQAFEMPDDHKVLALNFQHGILCMWALVDTDSPKSYHSFEVYGTGWQLPENPGEYIGTFQLSNGRFIFHVFKQV